MTSRLAGEHVLVTGGARGIGAAIVDKLLGDGARVSVFDIDRAEGERRATTLPADRSLLAAVDIRSSAAVAGGVAEAVDRFCAPDRPRQQCRTRQLRRSGHHERSRV